MHVHTTHTHPMGVRLSLAKGTSITLGLRSANASADPIPDAVIISTLKKKQCTLKKLFQTHPIGIRLSLASWTSMILGFRLANFPLLPIPV